MGRARWVTGRLMTGLGVVAGAGCGGLLVTEGVDGSPSVVEGSGDADVFTIDAGAVVDAIPETGLRDGGGVSDVRVPTPASVAACGTLPNSGPITIKAGAGDAPRGCGGQYHSPYELTEALDSSGALVGHTVRSALTLWGGRYEIVTQIDSDPEERTQGTYTEDGTDLVLTQTCPPAGDAGTKRVPCSFTDCHTPKLTLVRQALTMSYGGRPYCSTIH